VTFLLIRFISQACSQGGRVDAGMFFLLLLLFSAWLDIQPNITIDYSRKEKEKKTSIVCVTQTLTNINVLLEKVYLHFFEESFSIKVCTT